jgi:hypothetical protein
MGKGVRQGNASDMQDELQSYEQLQEQSQPGLGADGEETVAVERAADIVPVQSVQQEHADSILAEAPPARPKETPASREQAFPGSLEAGVNEAGQEAATDDTVASAMREGGRNARGQRDLLGLEALLGEAPPIDMRKLCEDIKGLPQVMSSRERASMAACRRPRNSRVLPEEARAQRPSSRARHVAPRPSGPAAPAEGLPSRATAGPDPRASPLESKEVQPQPAPPGREEYFPEAKSSIEAPADLAETPEEPVDSSIAKGGKVSKDSNPGRVSADSSSRRRHRLEDVRRAIAAQAQHRRASSVPCVLSYRRCFLAVNPCWQFISR